MSSSPQSIEPVNHPSTDSPNNTGTSSPHNNRRIKQSLRKQSVPLSRIRNFVFFALFFLFVSSLAAFFSVMVLKYPLKPELYIQRFYVPAIDKITPNITLDKDSAFLGLMFFNRNLLISLSYDNFLNVTIHYLPNSTTSIFFANVTYPGFNQNKDKDKSINITVPTVPSRMSGLLQLHKDYDTMVFRVDLGFSIRFHCRELGKHKHQFQMTAQVEVSMENGSDFIEDTIQMFEDSS